MLQQTEGGSANNTESKGEANSGQDTHEGSSWLQTPIPALGRYESDEQSEAKGKQVTAEQTKQMGIVCPITEQENVSTSALVKLVNIPVVHGQERVPLESLTNRDTCQVLTIPAKGGRKWKRLAQKTHAGTGVNEPQKDQGILDGSKRTWKLSDDCAEASADTEVNLRRRRMDTVEGTELMDVGVANLEWPQVYQ